MPSTAVISFAASLLALAATALAPAQAQFMRDHESEGGVRGFHGRGPLGGIKRSFQSDAEARAELDRILSALGLHFMGDRIVLRASAETTNAEAGISRDGSERFIFYNSTFMQRLRQKTAEQWTLVSILAHELGHHLALHTVIPGRDHEFELEADYFSGFVLRRLGATLDQSHEAMRAVSPKEATATHPGLDQRLQVITIGWTDAANPGGPRGPKAGGMQTAMAPKSQSAEATNAEAEAAAKRKAGEEAAQRIMPQPGQTFRDCNDGCPEMVVIPAGTFTMGSSPAEIAALTDQNPNHRYSWPSEGPERSVTVDRPFAVGKFEVTFAEWEACAIGGCTSNRTPNDQGWGKGRRPVVNVSWNDAKEYVNWLSRKTGQSYRLLAEAEWEYVARAGATTRYSWGNDIGRVNANCDGCGSQWDGKQTAPVGSFKANAFGLHDLHGNASEWVEDCWHGSYAGAPRNGSAWTTACSDGSRRVVRGSSWFTHPDLARAASRGAVGADVRGFALGFRVARTL